MGFDLCLSVYLGEKDLEYFKRKTALACYEGTNFLPHPKFENITSTLEKHDGLLMVYDFEDGAKEHFKFSFPAKAPCTWHPIGLFLPLVRSKSSLLNFLSAIPVVIPVPLMTWRTLSPNLLNSSVILKDEHGQRGQLLKCVNGTIIFRHRVTIFTNTSQL